MPMHVSIFKQDILMTKSNAHWSLWKILKALIKYFIYLVITICAVYGAISILGLFFLFSEEPCLGENAYKVGNECYYE